LPSALAFAARRLALTAALARLSALAVALTVTAAGRRLSFRPLTPPFARAAGGSLTTLTASPLRVALRARGSLRTAGALSTGTRSSSGTLSPSTRST